MFARSGHRCNATKLIEEIFCVRFLLWPDKLYSAKFKGGSNQRNDSCKSNIAHSSMVSSPSGHFNSGAPFLSKWKNILRDHLGNKHPLVMINIMRFTVLKISGKVWYCQKFQRPLPILSTELGKSQLCQVINWPRESVPSGVMGKQLFHFGVI